MWPFTRTPSVTSEEVSRLRAEVSSLREELVEVREKVYGWMKRVEQRARTTEAGALNAEPSAPTEGRGPLHFRGRRLMGAARGTPVVHDGGGPGAEA